MSDIFFNGEIYPTDGDFVIGGFRTDQKDNFTLSDFKFAFYQRVEEMVNEFMKRTAELYREEGFENPEKQAAEDTAKIVIDNLETELPEYIDADGICESIKKSIQAKTWIFNLQLRIQEFNPAVADASKGIVSRDNEKGSEYYDSAEFFTENTNLEQLIEQLSMIES